VWVREEGEKGKGGCEGRMGEERKMEGKAGCEGKRVRLSLVVAGVRGNESEA